MCSFFHLSLSISLGDKFEYISDEQSLQELFSEAQGRKNLIFFFVKGLGMKGENDRPVIVQFQKISILPHGMFFVLQLPPPPLPPPRNSSLASYIASKNGFKDPPPLRKLL